MLLVFLLLRPYLGPIKACQQLRKRVRVFQEIDRCPAATCQTQALCHRIPWPIGAALRHRRPYQPTDVVPEISFASFVVYSIAACPNRDAMTDITARTSHRCTKSCGKVFDHDLGLRTRWAQALLWPLSKAAAVPHRHQSSGFVASHDDIARSLSKEDRSSRIG
jgi:hypothetical protein